MKNETCCKGHPKTLGVIAIIMGILALMAPGITGFSITLLVGILVTIAGFARLFWAFGVGSFGKGLLTFLIGVLTILCGLAMIANPLFASGMLAIFLAAYFIADGFIEIVTGLFFRSISGWGWLVFGGIISILLGVIIIEQFPLSGSFAIGILFGIKLFLIGLIMVASGQMSDKRA